MFGSDGAYLGAVRSQNPGETRIVHFTDQSVFSHLIQTQSLATDSPKADSRPLAYLIVPTDFRCPACEVWMSRQSELPFRLEKKPMDNPPYGSWPVLHYPIGNGRWNYFNRTINEFLRYYETHPEVQGATT